MKNNESNSPLLRNSFGLRAGYSGRESEKWVREKEQIDFTIQVQALNIDEHSLNLDISSMADSLSASNDSSPNHGLPLSRLAPPLKALNLQRAADSSSPSSKQSNSTKKVLSQFASCEIPEEAEESDEQSPTFQLKDQRPVSASKLIVSVGRDRTAQ